MKKKHIILVVLIVYTALIMLPPLMHSYVYPNNGDDTAIHLAYFDTISYGEKVASAYWGQDMVGFPLVWASRLTGASIDALFLWFNFIALWLVGLAVFVLISQCIDWKAGLLAIPVVVFSTPATLGLFDAGAIFDLATVGIIVPLLLWCGIRLIVSRKLYWAIPTAIFGFLSVAFHTMVVFGIDTAKPVQAGEMPSVLEPSPSVSEFLFVLLGYMVIIYLVVAGVGLLFKKRALDINKDAKVLIVGLALLIAFLSILAFTDIVSWAQRVAIDLAVVVAILASFLIGIIVKTVNRRLVMSAVCILVIIGSIPILTIYFQYNSALKPIDMEAIAYVNSLPGAYYSCSPEVAPWVYNRFLNKEYKEGEFPYIARNVPSTSKTSPDTRYYWWEGLEKPNHSLDNAVKFKEGEVEISVLLR